MAEFAVEIPDGDIDRVITAMCANYKYASQIDNPSFDPSLEPPDPEIPEKITNPETQQQFANRMTREYLMNNTYTHEANVARSNAAANVAPPPDIVDPQLSSPDDTPLYG